MNALGEFEYFEPANGRQSYLKSKHHKGDIALRIMSEVKQDGPAIVVPYLNFAGRLATYQKIYPDGRKIALKGASTKRVYHEIGDFEESDVVVVAEGWATGTTMHLATGYPVFVAIGCQNLLDVAKHAKALSKDVLVCSDTGKKESELARKAAEAVGGLLFKPRFRSGVNGTDSNDFVQKFGTNQLQRQIEKYTERVSPAALSGDDQHELFSEILPWPEPVDGQELMRTIRSILNCYVSMPDHADTAAALWLIMTCLVDEIYTAAILGITSPTKQCGKTVLLSVVSRIAFRAFPTSNVSAAVVFRVTEMFAPTLAIDEADSFFGRNDELRGILNSGHSRDAGSVVRCVGEDFTPTVFKTFGPKVIAQIGKLPETLEDRAIVIRMRRKHADDNRKRLRRPKPNDAFDKLRQKITRWTNDNGADLDKVRARRIEGLSDRANDNWRPLFQIAKRLGGECLDEAVDAALALSKQEPGDDQSHGVLLLKDLKKLFKKADCTKLATVSILNALHKKVERPWPEFRNGEPITDRQLAKLLKPFGIKSKVDKVKRAGKADSTKRGYRLKDCRESFDRYC